MRSPIRRWAGRLGPSQEYMELKMGTLMAGATVAPSSVPSGGGSVEDEAVVVEVDVRWKGETLSMKWSVT